MAMKYSRVYVRWPPFGSLAGPPDRSPLIDPIHSAEDEPPMSNQSVPTSVLRLGATHLTGWTLVLIFSSIALGCLQQPAAEVKPISPSLQLNKQSAPIGSPIDLSYRFELGPDLVRGLDRLRCIRGTPG